MTLRQRIEANFETLGRQIVRRRWWVLVLLPLFALTLSSQAPTIGLDTSADVFLHEDDPAKVLYDEFRDQFGRGEFLIAAIRTPDALAPDFMLKLRDFHQALEDEVPHLEEVHSLINARVTRGMEDELIVEDLLEDWPENPDAWADLRAYVLANPLYANLLISEDARIATVSIETSAYSSEGIDVDLLSTAEDEEEDVAFLSGAENDEAVFATRLISERFHGEGFEIILSGQPAVQTEIATSMQRDMARFVGIMVLIIAGLLFLLFRRLSGVVLPLVVVAPAVSGTIGAMAIAGEKLSAPTQILPSLLLSVGIAAAVHILTIFFQRLDAGESREDAIAHALGHAGLPVCMASLTTAGGLLSFVTAEIAPVSVIGFFAPVGIGLALIYCLLLLPALLAVLPLRARQGGQDADSEEMKLDAIGRALVSIGDFSIRNARASVLVLLLIVGFSLVGASQLRFGHDILGWFDESHPIRIATHLFDSEMQGSMVLELTADTGQENGIQAPEVLNAIDALQGELLDAAPSAEIPVGKAMSIVDVVKEINQALNGNQAEHYRIPQDRQLIAQELLLFENSGSDDLEVLVDSQFRMARISLSVPYVDPILYVPYLEDLMDRFKERLGPGVDIGVTGFIPVVATTIESLIRSMTNSYILALLIITPLMMLLIGSFRIGLVSMLPNLSPIIITLGIMGWTGIVLDAFTLMIGGIAIGLAVDDTIHYMHNFRRGYLRTGDVREASKETLVTTGRALLVTSIVLSTGFFIFTFSELNNLYYFGLLTSITIANAFLIDIFVSPALMALIHRNAGDEGQGGSSSGRTPA